MKKSSQVHSQAWEQFQQLQKYHENGIKELAVERAELAARAAAMEAVSCIHEQGRQVQLKAISAISERGL